MGDGLCAAPDSPPFCVRMWEYVLEQLLGAPVRLFFVVFFVVLIPIPWKYLYIEYISICVFGSSMPLKTLRSPVRVAYG